jgi:hypothetical protein
MNAMKLNVGGDLYTVSGEEPWKKFSKGGPVDYCFIE